MAARRHRLSRPAAGLPALAALLALAGCATGVPPAGDSRSPEAEAGAEGAAGTAGSAAGALVAQSVNQRRAGDYARAEATLERALRIEPASPAVWLELARVRLAQGDYAQAEQLALKAESLADPRSPLIQEAHALGAEARRRIEQQ